HGWSRDSAHRGSQGRDLSARDAAAKEAAAREAAIQAAPAVPLPEAAPVTQGPSPEKITEMFLSMPVAPGGEGGAVPAAVVPSREDAPAETGAELPSEASKSGAGSDTAVIEGGKDTGAAADAQADAAAKKGVRSRGRSSVKKGTAAKRTKRRAGD
ncbi:MAG: hypothetical protein HUU15_19440, partial [Candidatus Brocadiae bacterium]|nr:hypothetical protein [Candidatus Brocadiia bacterium]